MPCLIQDRKGRSPFWYACFTTKDGKRLKKSTRQTDRMKAWDVLNFYVRAEGKIAAGTSTENQLRKTINDLLERLGERKVHVPCFWEQLDLWIGAKQGAVSNATILAYQQARDLFLKFLGRARAECSVRQITEKDVIDFRDRLRQEGRTASTVNKIKKYLAAPMKSALKQQLVDYNVFASADGLKADRVEKGTFDPEEVARLLAVVRGTDWEGAILVGYTTGARLQDVANLTWASIDTQNGVISYRERKGDKAHLAGLHPDLEDWITRQNANDDPSDFLFPSLANRPGGGGNGLSQNFKSIMKRAGVEGTLLRSPDRKGRSLRSLSFHSFRHGAASQVFNGAALRDMARRVTGHAEKGSLHRYLHDDIEAIRQATNLIPRLPKG